MTIKLKLFFVYLLIVTILLGSLTYLLVSRSMRIISGHVQSQAEISIKQYAHNLDQRLQSIEDVAYIFYLNMSFQRRLLDDYPNDRAAHEAYFEHVKPYVTVMQTTQDVHRIQFYSDNPTFRFANIIYLSDELRAESWYEGLMQAGNGMYWADEGRERWGGTDRISLKKRLNYYQESSSLLISIEVNKQLFYRLVSEETNGTRIIIQLPGGEVVVDTGADGADGSPAGGTAALLRMTDDRLGESFEYENIDGRYLVFHETLGRNTVQGAKVLMMVPVDQLMQDIQQTRNLAIGLLAITCLVAALLVYALTNGLLRRLTELSEKMKKLQRDNFKSYIHVQGKDEISQLGVIYNRMVKYLDELIHEVYAEKLHSKQLELSTREAQLYAMQSQINPHFLFNVLNSLRGNLLEKGDAESASVVGLLAKSFRILLKKKAPEIPLREELELIQIYLRIQQYRYAERLRFRIEVPDELLPALVPTMSLQPLIDNIMVHAVEKQAETVTIQVTVFADDSRSRLTMRIDDDGPGILPGRLVQIQEWLSDEDILREGQHLGLQNVHYRIRHRYGSDYGLRVERLARGTRVEFTLPLDRGTGEYA